MAWPQDGHGMGTGWTQYERGMTHDEHGMTQDGHGMNTTWTWHYAYLYELSFGLQEM